MSNQDRQADHESTAGASEEQEAGSAQLGSPPAGGDEQSKGVLGIATRAARLLFGDQYRDAHVVLHRSVPAPHQETWRVAARETALWLDAEHLRQHETVAPQKELKEAVRAMEARAWENGQRELHNRFAQHEGAIWIDIADPCWRAIRVTATGWEVTSEPPPLFRRYRHHQPLPEPARDGTLTRLHDFLPPMSDDEKLLCLIWTVLACVPTIARPMLIFVGHQGAAKSSACRRLRALTDPSSVALLGDDDRRDPILTLFHHAVPAFDNLGQFSGREADLFCRAVTGGGTARRKLYTDTGEVILDIRRPILLNGIHLPSTRSDFLDRAVIVRVERLAEYRPEEELHAAFTAALPGLLGGLLDVLARAMELQVGMTAPHDFRMADFARWGRAVAVALGRQADDFDKAYRNSVDRQASAVAEQDSIALAVIEYVNSRANELPFEEKGATLFKKLDDMAKKLELFGPRWPPGRPSMSVRLEALIPTLLTLGIKLTKLRREKQRPQPLALREGARQHGPVMTPRVTQA